MRSGVRWAETTCASYATPKSLSTLAACCITSQSLLEPITTPTSGLFSMVSVREVASFLQLPAVRVEDVLERGLHVDLRRPAEVLHRVGDGGHAVLHVLVPLAVV